MGTTCSNVFSTFVLPDLRARNTYNYAIKQNEIDENELRKFGRILFGNNEQLIKSYRSLLCYLFLLDKKSQFKDVNFQLIGTNLSKTQDYHRKQIQLYKPQPKIGLDLFQQQDMEFSYISAVLYYLCKNKQLLKKRILLGTQIDHNRHAYAFRLFCNGQEHCVIVDDVVPVKGNDDFEYSVVKGKEIWPALVEKAWCKQIGSYDKARGLSPEDCFEELTGLPAQSMKISSLSDDDIYMQLSKNLNQGYWLCVVAYNQAQTAKEGQVFVIQSLDDNLICLINPYSKFQSSTTSSTKHQRKGFLKIPFHTFRKHFEYLIIGYSKKNYAPITKKVKCQKRQQKLFRLQVDHTEKVSIRFTQFFNGYLNDQLKSNYDYSPVSTFQLYDAKGNLLNFCQGCDKMYSGAHSIYVSNEILYNLKQGSYYLRLEIDWEFSQKVNEGNLVIYATEGNVHIDEETDRNKIFMLHKHTLLTPNTVIAQGDAQQYELRFIEKKTNVLVSIKNKGQDLICLELNLHNSENFRVKYGKLLPNKTVVLNLAKDETKYLQILPEQVKKSFKVQPFTVKKISFAQK